MKIKVNKMLSNDIMVEIEIDTKDYMDEESAIAAINEFFQKHKIAVVSEGK